MHGGEAAVFLVMFAGGFAMIFGIYYLKTRQNMAMIEKGMNPRQIANRPAPYKNLKWAMLLMGAGVGLFLAYLLDEFALRRVGSYVSESGITRYYQKDNPAIYFALIAIGGGLGLFVSYLMEKKWWDENKGNPTV
jgi:hypothetical protein